MTLAIADFEVRIERMQTDQQQLLTVMTFNAEDEDLLLAWKRSMTDTVERLLTTGDTLNRASWQAAIGIFNAARDDIDLARGRLGELVAEADAALARYAIDFDAIHVERSGVLQGVMTMAALPPPGMLQKLNYGRGTGMAVARAAAGNGTWQVALAAAVFSGVMVMVNHEKELRQLKELEGQIKRQAETVRGDVKLIETELVQRMQPQFAGLLQLMARLETELQTLRAAEDEVGFEGEDSKAQAFRLACTFREAKYLLEMKAGN